MSAVLALPDADWVVLTLDGAWARETEVHERTARSRPAGHLEHPRRVQRPAQPLPGPASPDRPTRSTARPSASASCTRATSWPRSRSSPYATTRRPGRAWSRRRSAGTSPRARRSRRPEAVVAWSDAGLDGLSATYHGAVPRAARPRRVARSRAAGPAQQLGGHVLRLRRRAHRRDRDPRPGPRRRAVLPRRRLVRPPRRRRLVARRLGRRPAQAARRARRPGPPGHRPRALTFGLWIEPEMVSRDSDLYRAHPEWAIAHARAASSTESRRQLVLDLSRPEVVDHLATRHRRGPRQRPDRLRQVGHEPLDHRAVRRWTPAGAPGRGRPSLRPRPVRAVPAPDRALPGRPVRVVQQRRRAVRPGPAGLSPRRAGRATTPTPSSAWPSSGGPRTSTRSARWAPTCRPCPTTRPAGSRRWPRAPPWRCSGCSATSSIRPP